MQKLSSDPSSLGSKGPTIALDLLGSDVPASTLISNVLTTCQSLSHCAQFIVFHDSSTSVPIGNITNVEFVPVDTIITMQDHPLSALRKKKNSSIGIGISLLAKHKAQALISVGNTGALMAFAKTSLSMLKGIQRPGLLALIPTKQKELAVIDVGANTSPKAKNLLQYAAIGLAYQKSRGIENPTLGLLNIGTEQIKGTPEHQKAYLLLQELNETSPYPIFKGNIEGRDVFQGHIDVLVTDGFTGNVFLKTAEGIAAFLLEQLQKQLPSKESSFSHRLDYSEYPGAILCGVDGIVIKCHGTSKPQAISHSIIAALHLIEHQFLKKIKSELLL